MHVVRQKWLSESSIRLPIKIRRRFAHEASAHSVVHPARYLTGNISRGLRAHLDWKKRQFAACCVRNKAELPSIEASMALPNRSTYELNYQLVFFCCRSIRRTNEAWKSGDENADYVKNASEFEQLAADSCGCQNSVGSTGFAAMNQNIRLFRDRGEAETVTIDRALEKPWCLDAVMA
jgi:hypothetical protein